MSGQSVTAEQLYAALEEQPYPTTRSLRERFGIGEAAYGVLDAHYSVRCAQLFRPSDAEGMALRLERLGDAIDAAVALST